MKITSISIIFFIIACFSMWRTIVKIKKETIGMRSGILWIVMWAGVGFFSLFPELLDIAVRLAQMKIRIVFILLVTVFILFALVFDYASRMDSMQRNIVKLAREIAIINYKLEKEELAKKSINNRVPEE